MYCWPVKQETPVARPAHSKAGQQRELFGSHYEVKNHPHFTTPARTLHSRPHSVAMNMRNEGAL